MEGYRPTDKNTNLVRKHLIRHLGHLHPQALTQAHIANLLDHWKATTMPTTASTFRNITRRILLWLEATGTTPPGIAMSMPKIPRPQARLTICTPDERLRILQHSPPHFRVLVMLCADLGLRLGTALSISPAHYDPATETLTFTTKYQDTQSLPVTALLKDTLEAIPRTNPPTTTPYYELLQPTDPRVRRHQSVDAYRTWSHVKAAARVNPALRIHDLRRSAAEAVWHHSRDIRMVQRLLGHRSPSTTAL